MGPIQISESNVQQSKLNMILLFGVVYFSDFYGGSSSGGFIHHRLVVEATIEQLGTRRAKKLMLMPLPLFWSIVKPRFCYHHRHSFVSYSNWCRFGGCPSHWSQSHLDLSNQNNQIWLMSSKLFLIDQWNATNFKLTGGGGGRGGGRGGGGGKGRETFPAQFALLAVLPRSFFHPSKSFVTI